MDTKQRISNLIRELDIRARLDQLMQHQIMDANRSDLIQELELIEGII